MADRQEPNRNLAQMLKGGVIMDVTTAVRWRNITAFTRHPELN